MTHVAFARRTPSLNGAKQILISLVLAAAVAAPHEALRAAGPPPVNLGSTAGFTILAGAAITSTGGGAIIGNVGASPIAGSAINLTAAQVTGTIYAVDGTGPAGSVVDPTLLTTAKGDLTTAYNDAAGRSPTPTGPFLDPGAGNIGGLNLVPGLYKFTGTALITGANVTLTGGPNDVWIFQIAADLEVGTSIQVILAGGAQAGNIFWQVGTSATIGTFAAFEGTIIANQSVTLDTSSTIQGRALAFTAGVTFNGASASLPTPSNPSDAFLQVTIAPSAAAKAGARWQVDGGANQVSGATVTNLLAGSHTVSFTSVAGWNTPANQSVTITDGAATTASGLYIPSIIPRSGLILLTNGYGSIQHGAWPIDLVIGDKYVVTAVPQSKNVFSEWVGGTNEPYSVLNAAARYTFTMQSNLVLEANFVTNPFVSVKGTYNGLFATTNGVTEETAGLLSGLTVAPGGTYSGRVFVNGRSHVISGSFDSAGQATNHITRLAGGPLSVVLELNPNGLPPQVTGTVAGTNDGIPWVADLTADLAANALPSAEYTMLLLPNTNTAPTFSPGGDGYVLITNYAGTARDPAAARVRITGALADGTAFSQTAPVSQDGYVPIYANLYAGKGLLLGWINLDLTNTSAVSLTWIHPKRAAGLYKDAFTNVLFSNQILLSPWTHSPGIVDLLTNLSVLDTINAASPLLSYTLKISDDFELSEMSDPKLLSGSINRETGFLKVIFGNGASRITGYGAILLNATNGGGYVLTKTTALALKLEP
jgi:hypothetical protein